MIKSKTTIHNQYNILLFCNRRHARCVVAVREFFLGSGTTDMDDRSTATYTFVNCHPKITFFRGHTRTTLELQVFSHRGSTSYSCSHVQVLYLLLVYGRRHVNLSISLSASRDMCTQAACGSYRYQPDPQLDARRLERAVNMIMHVSSVNHEAL